MSPRELPARPNLEHLKKQARTLLQEAQSSEPSAMARFTEVSVASSAPKLADALHVIAREYGFESWPKLKLHVESNSEDAGLALTAAIRANDAKLVRSVLERHPSLTKQINEPLTHYSFDIPPIVAAAERESREVVDVLLAAGANINERSRWWAGSFGVLDFCGSELAEYLISRGATLDIHSAARLGKVDEVRAMLARDPQLVHARGGDGQLALHFAATVEIAELLLEHGAKVDVRDIDHESTAAQYMAGFGRYRNSPKSDRHDIVRLLISKGAETDILMASAIGDRTLVEEILNNDPDTVRVIVNEKHLPKRDLKSGGMIYFYGFGMTKTPHMIALDFGHRDVFELLMQRSAPWLRLSQAAEAEEESLVRELVQKHPAMMAKLTPNAARRIVGPAVRGNTRAVELLLECGWPANATLDNNQTALHYAAWHGNLAMLRMLLSHGAPVNVFETQHGGSPMGWALHGSENSWLRDKGDYPGVVRALFAAGATLPQPQGPWAATEEVMDVLREHELSEEPPQT
ncbi:Ankyrin [Candidatus Koribacter versatilis Ellin345]|uniref:Ankyrin n=1 Tax=Koribacter versatilis (strain Ellin345) TaxID=204669 RepID=Q1IP27_KORVE|nr:ankyrin repeat domain-containing protein [Candidatus Koribacter versatilis]ABF41373.1 Ankyrin [Candidatus Koribacter versatilis Ellin345]